MCLSKHAQIIILLILMETYAAATDVAFDVGRCFFTIRQFIF